MRKGVFGRLKKTPLLKDQTDCYELGYKEVVEFVNDAIVLYKHGRVIYVNPAFVTLLGYNTANEVIGLPLLDFVAQESRQLVAHQMSLRDQEAPKAYEIKALHKSGIELYVEIKSSFFSVHGNNIYIAAVRDINERKLTEIKLQQEVKFRNTIIEFSPAFFVAFNIDNKIMLMNKAMREALGYTESEVVGQDYLQLIIPEAERKILRKKLQRLVQFEETIINENGAVAKNGETLLVEWHGTAAKDQEGKFQYHFGFGIDVTERKKVEQELINKKNQMEVLAANKKAIFDSTSDFIWSVDRNFRLIFTNQAMRQHHINLYGVDPRNEDRLREVMPAERFQFWEKLYVQALVEGPFMVELETDRDGRIFECTINPIYVKDEAVAVAVYCKDITERKQAEHMLKVANNLLEIKVEERTHELTCLNEELTAMNEQLTAMNQEVLAVNEELHKAREVADSATKAKSTFIANMSHEIRTPMNAILGFSQLMQRKENLEPQQRQYIDNINKAGNHLLELINGILDMSKIEAGRMTLHAEKIDLHLLLKDIDQMFRSRAENKGLHFDVHLSDDLPKTVMLDEGRLRQVLINLLGNAVKFTKKGNVILRARARRSDRDELLLDFEIEDTGSGICQEDMERLFQAFEQGGENSERISGTGLGLAISHEIIKLMQGEIIVKSQVGKGSIFRFYMHAQPAADNPVQVISENRRIKSVCNNTVPYRVLIVDDEEMNRILLAVLLENLGFEIKQAVNGQVAVSLTETWHPDIILMDMKMPVMDGFEAINQIRASKELSKVPIIAVTASVFGDARQKTLDAGADEFLCKPFKELELLEIIGKLLQAEFEYEDFSETTSDAETVVSNGGDSREVLQQLPKDLVHNLKNAVLEGDYYEVLSLVGQVENYNVNLAAEIRRLNQLYHFEQLIDLLSGGEA